MTPLALESYVSLFAATALRHVVREWPYKLDHVMAGPHDLAQPHELHPIFYGSFDWHSCVHGWWTLVRARRLFPDLPEAGRVRALADAQFTPEKVAAEQAYFERPESRAFERPYGWAWLLKLDAELALDASPEGRRWSRTLRPLAELLADRLVAYLALCDYPVRAGTHANSAFALRLAADWAEIVDDRRLLHVCRDKARVWYGPDAGAAGPEPSQDDFLSPTLMAAECVRRLSPPDEFRRWFAERLPEVARGRPAALFAPPVVSDRTDGKIAHLDGLSLSRAWCWRALARALDPGPAAEGALAAADAHLAAGLPHVTGPYAGEHWLQTFALLALTET